MSDRKRSREHHEDRHERKKHKKSKQEVDKYKNQTRKLIQEEEDNKPEDCIPDDHGNEDARNFLAHEPTKGLWMPLGKEAYEDPMYDIIRENKCSEKETRIQQLKQLLQDTTSDSSSSASSDHIWKRKKEKKRRRGRNKRRSIRPRAAKTLTQTETSPVVLMPKIPLVKLCFRSLPYQI